MRAVILHRDGSAREVGLDSLTPAQRRSFKLASILIGPLSVLLVTFVLIFFVLFNTSTVDGRSMYPTLLDHDYVLVSKGLSEPRRGDIVIMRVSENGVPTEWIKRVVAIGGDEVKVAGDRILVNGKGESFPHLIIDSGESAPELDTVVPEGHVFIAGDNRAVSFDSRFTGTFPVTSIAGRVVAIYAPVSRVGLIPAP